MFGHDWEGGSAKIIARKPLSAGPHGVTIRWSYVGDVQPDNGGPVFRATFHDPHTNGELISPDEGQVVRVKIKPGGDEVKLDRSDPSLSLRAQEKKEREEAKDRFERLANAEPGDHVD